MKHKKLLALLTIVILFAAPLASVFSQSPLPEPVKPEPYPFSDRFPALALVDDLADWQTLRAQSVEMEGVRAVDGGGLGAQFEPVMVSVYVNEKEEAQLKAAGVQVVPVLNEGLRARLWDGLGITEPSGWPTYAQYQTRLQTIATSYPAIARVVSIGKSVQTRDILCIEITDNPYNEEDEPEVKFSSSIHGDEVTGMEMSLRLAEYLTSNYATDATVSQMVNGMDIWLCPMHNPDGYAAVSRYNANGVDLNRDFPEALNGDANLPNALQAENKAFWNFEQAHTFVMGGNYHGGAQVANYPWDANHGVGASCIAAPDDSVFYAYSKGYAALNSDLLAGGFADGVTLGCAWYEVQNGMQDWAYNWYSEHHVTFEISNTKTPSYSSMNTYWLHNRDAMLWWLQRSLMGARGLVTDANTGAPLSATVSLVGGSGLPVYTDPQVGDYHRLMLPGNYTLKASARCYLDQTAAVTVGSATATVQNFALLPAPNFSVTGVVTDTVSGLPISGATVELLETGQVATTTLDGSYSLTACQGSYTLQAEAPGYQAAQRSITLSGEQIQNFALQPIAPVLVVDDDAGKTYQTYYQDALTAAGYTYDTHIVASQGSPSAADLLPYRFVVWLTGDDASTSLSSGEQTALQSYLDGGGRLFVSGQEIGYDIGTSSFYLNYLHANYVSDDTNTYNLSGLDFFAGTNITISGTGGANNQTYPDEVTARAPGVSIWDYAGSYQSGGVAFKDSTYCTVYFSFGFEAITPVASRTLVMDQAMDWLDTCRTNLSANLLTSKTDGLESVHPGAVVTYTIMVSNLGPDDAADVDLRDTLPVALRDASWSCTASLGSACSAYSGGGSPVLLVDLLNGGVATLTVSATVIETASGTLQNTAVATLPAGYIDPQLANNQATDQTTILWYLTYLPTVLR